MELPSTKSALDQENSFAWSSFFFTAYPMFILPNYHCFIFSPLNSKVGKSGRIAIFNIDIYEKNVYIANVLQLDFKNVFFKEKTYDKMDKKAEWSRRTTIKGDKQWRTSVYYGKTFWKKVLPF